MKYHKLQNLIPRLKMIVLNKSRCLSTDNVLTRKFDKRSIHSNIKNNITLLKLLNENLVCRTFVRRRQRTPGYRLFQEIYIILRIWLRFWLRDSEWWLRTFPIISSSLTYVFSSISIQLSKKIAKYNGTELEIPVYRFFFLLKIIIFLLINIRYSRYIWNLCYQPGFKNIVFQYHIMMSHNLCALGFYGTSV